MREGTALAKARSAYAYFQEVSDWERALLTYGRLQTFAVAGFPFPTVGCGGPVGDWMATVQNFSEMALCGAIWVASLFDFPLDGLFRLEIRSLIPFRTIFHFITHFWRLARDTKITRLHFLTEVFSSTGFVSWQLLFWGRIFLSFFLFFFFPDHFDKDFPPWGAPFPKDEQTR